jgi:hypothetical protein
LPPIVPPMCPVPMTAILMNLFNPQPGRALRADPARPLVGECAAG